LSVGDVERLKDFPGHEYILTPRDQQAVYFGLVDIIAAYCYDHRTTEGEPTSESAWTINKLSATLSWFEVIIWQRDPLLQMNLLKILGIIVLPPLLHQKDSRMSSCSACIKVHIILNNGPIL